ncbi:major antigen isoform X2 [Venturia canescens]|uniref:major antigen isoform X2 n=1 Tax=Venturia canescens TaxID=32260 RepID=UPI001C9C285D|nr:major antigen isoform X2 [Venturia canescens]
MMSDSDDTDVLLLIPPDLFTVASSDSDDDSRVGHARKYRETSVVSEILEHVQSLENRINVIESRDNSLEVSLLNASLDSYSQAISHPNIEFSPTKISQPTHSLSRLSSLQNTPVKPLCCSSSKSSPGCIPLSIVTNTPRGNPPNRFRRSKLSDVTNPTNSSRIWQKREDLINLGTPVKQSFENIQNSPKLERHFMHSFVTDQERSKESSECLIHGKSSSNQEAKKDIGEMELSEVDELLQEMEATEIELARRIDNSNARRCSEEQEGSRNFTDYSTVPCGKILKETKFSAKSPMRRLDFQFADVDFQRPFTSLNFPRDKVHADVSLPEDIFPSEETKPRFTDFKVWDRSVGNFDHVKNEPNNKNTEKPIKLIEEHDGNSEKVSDRGIIRRTVISSNTAENPTLENSEPLDVQTQMPSIKSSSARSMPNMNNSMSVLYGNTDNGKLHSNGFVHDGTNDTVDSGLQGTRQSQNTDELQQTIREIRMTGKQGMNSLSTRSIENCPRKTQRLLALSDFWDCDGTKSQEEMLRIKLEEEKFRREHCEHLIQELQKRLLEQQEKVAVAIRVDNEKNAAISQFQEAWSKLRQRWETLEKDHSELESTLKSLTEKHNSEVSAYQQQIKRGEGELSKALDLAAGYKEKSDSLVKEKLELLKAHADELENYKLLVQEAEQRYENLKEDYSKLVERNRQLDEIDNNLQQELNKERLRNSEVRSEMGAIHKALDACEAELTILRQEKENLQLKIKEEVTRNGILEQGRAALLQAVSEAQNLEKAAKDEIKSLVDRQDQIRSELREIYQNQLDDVVKTKLKEFQGQLDAAEMAFQADLETRQRAIAECAARKIKGIIDKHQLEINLLEEKHLEEKRLSEIQLAQASQKAVMLEVQLNTQRAGKTQLAEQLHSVMQKQWQQALQIISENLSPLQRLNVERISEGKSLKRCHSACCNKEHRSVRSELRSASSQNLQTVNLRQEQDESLITLASNDETPLSRKESKDDLRKYIKMILDMQQPNKDEFVRAKYQEDTNASPPPVVREVPRKHYTKKDSNGLSEESVTWQRVDESSIHDTSEHMQVPHFQGPKIEQPKNKPPWK